MQRQKISVLELNCVFMMMFLFLKFLELHTPVIGICPRLLPDIFDLFEEIRIFFKKERKDSVPNAVSLKGKILI